MPKEYPDPTFDPVDERTALSQWLDYHRGVLLWKLEGLSEDDAKRAMVPSGTSLAGLVKHLADVERYWFGEVFMGTPLEQPAEVERAWYFSAQEGETVAQIATDYRDACRDSRDIVAAAASLDDVAKHGTRRPNLRWIMLHMIEETARHNGHADIVRELIDGVTGE